MTPSNYDTSSDDDYPYYRGIRLQFLPGNRMYWRGPQLRADYEDDIFIRVAVKSGHEDIVRELLKIRPEGGSCRITEMREVLVKIVDANETKAEIPRYVCHLRKPLVFEDNIDNRPDGLAPGDIWTGIYDGTRFAFLPSATGGQNVWWSTVEDFSTRYAVETKIPRDILFHLRAWKPIGGRFCVTPDGYVITLVERELLSQSQKKHYFELDGHARDLLGIKRQRTNMVPVFIGIWDVDQIHFRRPRKWGEPLSGNDKENMLKTISSFLGGDSVGMVNSESKSEGPEDDPDLIKDYIPDSENREVALLMEEE